MPANIVLRDLTNPPKKGNSSPIIATRADLRDGARVAEQQPGQGSQPVPGNVSLVKVSGGIDQGDVVRIVPDGSTSFGTKPEGPSVLHDFVDVTYERGQVNAFNSGLADGVQFANTEPDRIYEQVRTGELMPSVLISGAEAARHQYASRAYRTGGNYGRIERPREFTRNGKDAGHRTMYFAAWVKYKENSQFMRAVSDETTTGAFIEGEALITNGGEFVGYYSYFDDGAFANLKHHLIIDNGRIPADSELYGKTMVGQSSGATIVFPSSENWITQYTTVNEIGYPFLRLRFPKQGRWWDNPNGNTAGGNEDYIRCSISTNDGYLARSDARYPVRFYTPATIVPGQWALFELEFDAGENGFFRHRYGHETREETTFQGPVGDPNYSPEISQFGIDGGWVDRQQVTIGEVYFDYTRHRVYLADAATWDQVTFYELQRLVSWQEDAVEVGLHYGALSEGWIYVIGADGLPVNETGLRVQ